MRKYQKKQAEEFIEVLKEVHSAIIEAIKVNQRDSALDLLSQCQDGALRLGELIESVEGEGGKTISHLEDYCELVYQVYVDIGQGQEICADWTAEKLGNALEQIEESISIDIKVRMEIVFLPYKASMWDSLESVWRAAEEDPDCDAFVIPIPYFDKNPDGGLGEMHYEGDQYPDDVPVTHYEDYDFEGRHPDMVFIHNPYDDCNSVTSVLPFFYSANLKKFTEKLIYLPYFVLEEIDPDDEQAREGIKHLCILPGVLRAHKVIVQSENMRQAYIRILTDEFGERTRKYWENKILGLGSPKTDKVSAAKQKDQKIPEEWMRSIRKEDGNRKKVILYNTGITALLRHEEKMLEKMMDVFRIFKENREEVALLWRPHPLIRATIESLRPQLWEAYRKLAEWYRNEGWGIYDDTADVDRAIAVSDAYYGDWSSLVTLCRSVGMPVMIQDVEINS